MADCKSCKSKEQPSEAVPYIVHEGMMARAERTAKRLWITILLLIVLLVGTNAGWIWHESQFEDIAISQENEDGYNNFIGNDGDIFNGETDN